MARGETSVGGVLLVVGLVAIIFAVPKEVWATTLVVAAVAGAVWVIAKLNGARKVSPRPTSPRF